MKKTQDPRCKTHDANGFSLTEVFLALGILAVGMLFIAGVFPVSIHFTTVASERTIAATAADEAFAKIKLYGIPGGVVDNSQTSLSAVYPNVEYAYPSTPTSDPNAKQYWWSAMCRRVGPNDVQVTVFISRKVGFSTTRPVATSVAVTAGIGNDELITGASRNIGDGCTIVDGQTGQIYRVLERYKSPNDSVIRLDKPWQGGVLIPPLNLVWVIPPAASGRYPCIAVYQKVMRF
jgi:type II secretory pathway pseudopilin PulG